MRCSICDKDDSRFVYKNWHCSECEEVIRQCIGLEKENDVEEGEVPILEEDSEYAIIDEGLDSEDIY
jgi:hypothetical protein